MALCLEVRTCSGFSTHRTFWVHMCYSTTLRSKPTCRSSSIVIHVSIATGHHTYQCIKHCIHIRKIHGSISRKIHGSISRKIHGSIFRRKKCIFLHVIVPLVYPISATNIVRVIRHRSTNKVRIVGMSCILSLWLGWLGLYIMFIRAIS